VVAVSKIAAAHHALSDFLRLGRIPMQCLPLRAKWAAV
jgi:hypothetical protein